MPTFQKRFVAAVEHIFNVHDNCDSSWCKYHNNKQLTEKDGKGKYKDVSYKCYKLIRETHDKLTTIERLKEVHHSFNTQKNESLNRAIAKQAPKNITYSKSISLKARVAFVVSVTSIGYEATVERLCEKLQIDYPTSIRQSWKNLDKRKGYKRIYDNKTTVKRRRTRVAKENMKKLRLEENTAKKKGLDYCSGMAIDIDENNNNEAHILNNDNATANAEVDAKVDKKCICGSNTHRRVSSHKCIFWQRKNKIITSECVETTQVDNEGTSIQQLDENTERK